MNVKEATVKRIELLCKRNGIAYNELANQCGVTPSTIYSVLDPKRKNITLTTIKKICDGLEITLGDFFSDPIFDSLEQEII
ncbi:helix-turn-helix transcriptional regulator [Lachnospiraceae bacterium 54-53]